MPAGKLRMTAQQREFRRLRIMGMVQAGYSYLAIADSEQLSKERVRQIVVASLKVKDEGTKGDLALVQMARLEPALRLASGAVAKGRIEAIDRLIRVLDRIDKYATVEIAVNHDYAGARERLMRKINRVAARILAEQKDASAAGAAADSPTPEPSEEASGKPGWLSLQPLENP